MNKPPPGTPCVTWLPPADEHRLAMSLGLVDQDRRRYMDMLVAIEAEAERMGFTVHRGRWRVHRIVYQLSSLGMENNTKSRAAVYASLRNEAEDRR